MMDNMHTGEIIKARRTERGMSQQALADAVGVSQVMISYLERGERQVVTARLQHYANALNVDVQILIEGIISQENSGASSAA